MVLQQKVVQAYQLPDRIRDKRGSFVTAYDMQISTLSYRVLRVEGYIPLLLLLLLQLVLILILLHIQLPMLVAVVVVLIIVII